jgi:hypothetical protein
MSVFDITVMHAILEKIHSTTDFIFMISEVEGISGDCHRIDHFWRT